MAQKPKTQRKAVDEPTNTNIAGKSWVITRKGRDIFVEFEIFGK